MPVNAFGAAKSRVGQFRDLASATALILPGDWHKFRLTGTTTVETISAPIKPGRVVHLTGPSGTSLTLTNNNDTTTDGQMDLGGSNITLGDEDHVQLVQRADGHWELLTNAAN